MRRRIWLSDAVELRQVYTYSRRSRVKYQEILESRYSLNPMMKKKQEQPLVELGKCIRKLRESQGITQEDFAVQAGLDRAYYGGIERGERNPTALKLIQIAIHLNVEVGRLFPPVTKLIDLEL